jgi:hypothetical protein
MDSVVRKERAAGNGDLGIGGRLRNRREDVLVMLADIEHCCLQRTKGGYPWHPLYVRSTARPAKIGGILRKLLLRVSPVKSTSAPLLC